jgi:hypothetical protein
VVDQAGPRDWLAGGRHWDDGPSSQPMGARSMQSSARPAVAYQAPLVSGNLLSWLALSLAAACVALGIVVRPTSASQLSPLAIAGIAIGLGLLAVLLGLRVGKIRRMGVTRARFIPTVAILFGLIGSVGSGYLFLHPTSEVPMGVAAPLPAPVVSPTGVTGAPVVAPATAPAAVSSEPVRPVATRMSMSMTLATIAYVLRETRGDDGLQSPQLAITSTGAVTDPFAANPARILFYIPLATTLHYEATPDRRTYAMTLTSLSNANLVVHYASDIDRLSYG